MFTKIYVDSDGNPTQEITEWIADAFVIFAWVIYIGKIRHVSELDQQ